MFETEFQAKKTQQGVKDQNPLTKKKGGVCGFIFRDLIDERINLGGWRIVRIWGRFVEGDGGGDHNSKEGKFQPLFF